jgi:hypothetical protein
MNTIKKFFQVFGLLVFLSVFIYLLLPSPSEPPPLPQSRRSTEPGDMGQIPGLFAAYYTNLSRSEVLNYYQNYFIRSSLLDIPFITYRLNHPPEYTWQVLRETEHSSFLEELVHPFRESWFINGYEPLKDPFAKEGQELANFKFDGQEYSLKVQVLQKDSSVFIRLVIFILSVFCLIWLGRQVRQIYNRWQNTVDF